MIEENNEVMERMEGQAVNEVAVVQSGKMEFRLINPTEDGFLREIKWNKEELEAAVRQKVSDYQNVVYTEDSMKEAKAVRADLNKLKKAIDDRRKMVKKIINEPYRIFEEELKEILAFIQEPVDLIDQQVKAFEDQQREEKKSSIRAAYDEAIGDLAGVLPFERVFDSRYLNQTYKLATAQADIKAKIEKVRTDLETIDSLDSKYKLNAKDVYIKTFDLSKALAENKRLSDLEEKLEAEKRRKAEEEAERKRLAEERRKEAEERARLVEEQSNAQESRSAAEAAPFVETAESVGELPETDTETRKSVTEPEENVSEDTESVSESVENVSDAEDGTYSPDVPASSVAADPFAAQEDTKQYKASFTVYGTKSQIMVLRQFMIDNNIRFGKVEK